MFPNTTLFLKLRKEKTIRLTLFLKGRGAAAVAAVAVRFPNGGIKSITGIKIKVITLQEILSFPDQGSRKVLSP